MKAPLKAVLIVAAIVALLGLSWAGGILYWELRVRSALRSWEREFAQDPGRVRSADGRSCERMEILSEAGCRALPAMVAAVNESTDRAFQQAGMDLILALLFRPSKDAAFEDPTLSDYYGRWTLHTDVPLLEQTRKLDDFSAWWKEHRREYHQPWRFWSEDCAAAVR